MAFNVCACGKPAIGVVVEHVGNGKSPMAGITRGHYACEDHWQSHTDFEPEDPEEKQKVLRDGRGKPIDEKAHYYIQDTRQVVGNCALFWRPDGAGYTCDLLDAGVYLGSHAKPGKRDTDVYWPVEVVRKQTIVHVRVERLREMAPKRRVRKAK